MAAGGRYAADRLRRAHRRRQPRPVGRARRPEPARARGRRSTTARCGACTATRSPTLDAADLGRRARALPGPGVDRHQRQRPYPRRPGGRARADRAARSRRRPPGGAVAVALELATNRWSDHMRITLVGFDGELGEGLAEIAPDRIRSVRDPRRGAARAGGPQRGGAPGARRVRRRLGADRPLPRRVRRGVDAALPDHGGAALRTGRRTGWSRSPAPARGWRPGTWSPATCRAPPGPGTSTRRPAARRGARLRRRRPARRRRRVPRRVRAVPRRRPARPRRAAGPRRRGGAPGRAAVVGRDPAARPHRGGGAGPMDDGRRALCTEVLVYLAAHPEGVHPRCWRRDLAAGRERRRPRRGRRACRRLAGPRRAGPPEPVHDERGRIRLGSEVRVDWERVPLAGVAVGGGARFGDRLHVARAGPRPRSPAGGPAARAVRWLATRTSSTRRPRGSSTWRTASS